MMYQVKQTILNQLDSLERHQQSEAVRLSGYRNMSSIKKVLRSETSEFDNFHGLVNMIQIAFPNNEFEVMSKYISESSINRKVVKNMLEYLDLNNLHDEKQSLIERIEKEATNKDILTLAKLYRIDHQSLTKQIDPADALKLLHQVKTSSLETDIIKAIFIAYVYLDRKLYEQCLVSIEAWEGELLSLTEPYIKETYFTRVRILQAECNARMGNLKRSRKYCDDVIENTSIDSMKGWASLQIANTYAITDYLKANHYIMQGLYFQNIHERTRLNLERSSNFLNNLHNKQPLFLRYDSEETSDRCGVAFYLINQGKKDEALEVLQMCNLETMDINDMAFYFYLKGMIQDSFEDYVRSVKYFRKSGDTYFRQLPLAKLKESNMPQSIISLLAE
ncbi:MAG: AimR family lysis-lysogeny pheromone receptor [Bacillaceae bacterium]